MLVVPDGAGEESREDDAFLEERGDEKNQRSADEVQQSTRCIHPIIVHACMVVRVCGCLCVLVYSYCNRCAVIGRMGRTMRTCGMAWTRAACPSATADHLHTHHHTVSVTAEIPNGCILTLWCKRDDNGSHDDECGDQGRRDHARHASVLSTQLTEQMRAV